MSKQDINFSYSNNVIIQPLKFGTKPRLCKKCGKPHHKRSRNKNPELCQSCAVSIAAKNRWEQWRQQNKRQ